MKWEPHYTGIDVAQGTWWYLQRDSKTQEIQFARVSAFRRILGIKRGSMVHGWNERGFEIFTLDLHIGWAKASGWRITWSGSSRDPYHTYTLHLGRLRIGSRTDNWIKRIMVRRSQKACEEMARSWEKHNEE